MKAKRWQDWGILSLGVWLVLSPWFLNFFGDIGLDSADFAGTGIAIAALALVALARRVLWGEWLTLVLGLWMAGSPWLLGFEASSPAMPDAAAAGTAAALLAIWVILRHSPDPYEQRP